MSEGVFFLISHQDFVLANSLTSPPILFTIRLCDEGAGGRALVSPGWWKSTDGLVVAGETVNTGFDKNETELGVFVLAVALEMLADGDGLLDEHVKI
jgi:hypothetical protein